MPRPRGGQPPQAEPVRLAVGCPPAGEIHEFKVDLASVDRGKKKDAVKKVIAGEGPLGRQLGVEWPRDLAAAAP